MKSFFCFILLFSICFCEDSQVSDTRVEDAYGVQRDGGKYDALENYKDDQDYIIRPCSYQDVNCIRHVFAQNSHCSPVHGPAPDPYMLERLPLNVPRANLTYNLNHVQIKGLNEWKIKEFYINKATDRLVFEVEFDRMLVASPGSTIRFYRKGKEPVDISDYSIIEYLGVSLTLTIPHIKDGIQLSKGHVYAYIPDATPKYTIGPAFFSSKDPAVNLALAELLLNVGLSVREAFVTQGPVTMNVYLQTTICNFGHRY